MELATFAETSAPYLGQWRRLVSTTNWEKGRIICQWREALRTAGAAASEYSDDAWSREVHAAVTQQHVGRLRRVYERFGQVHASYEGLYWSHFQAALDWDDAEMWLEGALQNRWPVAQMRERRAEVLGAVEETAGDLSEVEVDDDAEAFDAPPDGSVHAEFDVVQAALDDGDDDAGYDSENGDDRSTAESDTAARRTDATLSPVRAARLSDDFVEALEGLKACLLRHKMSGWRDTSQSDVVAALDELRALAIGD